MKSAQTSSYRDRTHEFSSITERLRKSLAPSIGVNGSGGGGGRSSVAFQSEFNKRASKIGYGIHHTSQKLAKLAKLAKRTSVFDDPTKEIQELTAVIKQDITALNSAVVDLQLVCNSQNESENVSSDTTTHSTTVVDNLKNRLMSTAKEFKDVLTMRTEQQQMVPLQDSYMQSRAEALHNVESTIHELGSIFTQLATMVSQQGELAIRSFNIRTQQRSPKQPQQKFNSDPTPTRAASTRPDADVLRFDSARRQRAMV